MTIAVMQPYFFPYLGYFELLASSDTYVHYDNAAFSKNGWQNRNRISDGKGGWAYFGVSVRSDHLGTPIKDIRLANKHKDSRRLQTMLDTYRRAPFFTEVSALVARVLEIESERLGDLSIASVEASAAYLGLNPTIRTASELPVDYSGGPVEKVLGLCDALNAKRYLNLSGGRELYDHNAFAALGIELRFTSPEPIYVPGRSSGESLSIIDTMMFSSPEDIRAALRRASNE